MSSRPESLQQWISFISSSELPAFGKTMQSLTALNKYMDSHAAELARIILHDPNITAKVLKVANSVHYNTTVRKVNTISRAVMVLGFQTIKEICMASTLFDSLIKSHKNEFVQKAIAKSFLAAMQSKSIAKLAKVKSFEELFIAALLYNIGEIVFWAFAEHKTDELTQVIESGMVESKAQRLVLGFTLQELSNGLNRQWQLSELLLEAQNQNSSAELEGRIVYLSHEISELRVLGKPITRHLEKLKLLVNKNEADVVESLDDACRETSSLLGSYGLQEAVKFLPKLLADVDFDEDEGLDAVAGDCVNVSGNDPTVSEQSNVVLQPNQNLQLEIIREMTMLANEENVDINLILQLVLEGLHRGGGLGRTLVAIFDRINNKTVAKYSIESESSDLKERFGFELSGNQLFIQILQSKKCFLFEEGDELVSARNVMRRLDVSSFLIGPLTINDKVIGCFYADNIGDIKELKQSDLDVFQLFINQSALCLRSLAARK